ncbi:TPR-like protein [Dichomitus squalens]|uniref:TPR-like protein n=1 Tax=Dichomitus squalens TaxID=114155 RepID=A0A4Q9PVM0_9APHY|nr:TPR-like protein [Dichomitus squalens]
MCLDVQAIEKALLTGKWDNGLDSSSDAPVLKIAKNVVNGDFRDLTASPSRDLFAVTQSNEDLVDRPLTEWFDYTQRLSSGTPGTPDDELLRLSCAVACLHAFLQANWTGPHLDIKPLDVLAFGTPFSQLVNEDLLHQKAVSELAYGGEPAYHLAKFPIFLQLARILLDTPFQHCRSVPWWRLRTWRVHEQVLDEPVAVPEDVFTAVSPLLDGFASEPDVAGRLLLEQGLLEHYVGHDKSAADYFVRAARATELEYELTGALGKRTKFQETDVTQLVLLAESRVRGDGTDPTQDAGGVNGEGPQAGSTNGTVETAKPSNAAAKASEPALPETLLLNDDTLLEQTAFTSSTNAGTLGSRLSRIDPASQPALHPLDQAVLLALCLNVKNTSPVHGLTAEQMAPYVARVISHPRNWTVHTVALLLRSRLESNRTRTVERSVLQLQALVDQMPTADSALPERLLYIHDLLLPSRWEMEKELANRFLTIGVVKSALEIFERLEMWEEVVKCWASMERADKGRAIVRDLLDGRKTEADTVITHGKALSEARRRSLDSTREAKLWCLLGDLEPEHALEHYTRAWEISRESSGRAMRSLGGYHFARGNYEDAITCLRRAVAINPLQARSWFVLGCACLREEDWDGAREAFVRCVGIDDEDGESWNNLASVYMRMGAGKAAKLEDEDSAKQLGESTALGAAENRIPFANKLLAFRALKQGLKFAYDNWRMWNNYMIVALDVGELSEACRALSRVVEERAVKDGAACVDEDVLDRLVEAATRGPEDAGASGGEGATAEAKKATQTTGLERRVEELFTRTILPRVSSPRIFRAWARLLTAQGRYADALNAHLDAYRAGPAGTIEKGETDVEKWRGAVGEVEEIVDVLRNFGPRYGEGFNWKLQARSIVRTFMGRTRDFEDEPEWARLVALQEEIRKEE